MWLKVAKGVPRLLQGVPIGSNGGFKEAQFQGGFQGGFQEKVLPDVAKCRQRGSKGVSKGPKGFQTVPRVPRGSKGKVLPDVAKNAKGVLRESATRCGKKSPKGFQKSSKVVQLYLLRHTGSNACLRCWRRRRVAQGQKGPELVINIFGRVHVKKPVPKPVV